MLQDYANNLQSELDCINEQLKYVNEELANETSKRGS